MSRIGKSLETKIIHAGEPQPRILGSVTPPIFQSSTFEYVGEESYHDIRYMRLNNTPNHDVLHGKLAALENSEAALVTASGMAAISTTLLTLLGQGDHLLVQNCLYGGTHSLVTGDFKTMGITHDFFNGDAPNTWQQKLRPNTRVIYVETMSNPLLEIADLRAVIKFAKAHGLISIIDNTFASPVNFRPIDLGFDLSVHSCTKYLNGHSDIVAGAVMGSASNIEKIKHKLNHLGGSLDTHACFLLHRGIKTLSVRVKHQNASAGKIADFLCEHAKVQRVYYPGLKAHAQHSRAAELFDGFGGVVSFELKGGVAAAKEFIQRLNLAVHAPSLGGVETLITLPGPTTHSLLSAKEKLQAGIPDGLIRLSIGLEATEDLIEDLDQAL